MLIVVSSSTTGAVLRPSRAADSGRHQDLHVEQAVHHRGRDGGQCQNSLVPALRRFAAGDGLDDGDPADRSALALLNESAAHTLTPGAISG